VLVLVIPWRCMAITPPRAKGGLAVNVILTAGRRDGFMRAG
jgi:hypothetical protein